MSAQIVERLAKNLLIGAFLAVLSIVFPPVAIIAILFGVFAVTQKFKRFNRRSPFLITSMVVYLGLWSGTKWVRHGMASAAIGHPAQALWAIGVGLAGILLLLSIMWLCALFGVDPTTALFYTLGYGWYVVVFLLTFIIPDVDVDADTDDTGGEWDGEVDWRRRF